MNIPIAICLCLLSSTGIFSKNVRIIGGAPGLISDFPFMVSIRTFQTNQLICGGSIISRWNILTAAHCLYVFDNDYTDVRVYSGTASSIEMYGFNYQIDHVYFHPQFNFLNLNGVYLHDISVVKNF
ncbi:PREDICTED: serine protease 44-like [Ceratosolen solmsi marchali]|uniref:Serine protease 44-like n=1 Tax=Ceratosolen solmsi marchali TaxID=326594 RepID=A0AAJ7DV77_9HYME|nr:PREDICTED: serine protease 44-like [Ceratosolen solmsi marchali]